MFQGVYGLGNTVLTWILGSPNPLVFGRKNGWSGIIGSHFWQNVNSYTNDLFYLNLKHGVISSTDSLYLPKKHGVISYTDLFIF